MFMLENPANNKIQLIKINYRSRIITCSARRSHFYCTQSAVRDAESQELPGVCGTETGLSVHTHTPTYTTLWGVFIAPPRYLSVPFDQFDPPSRASCPKKRSEECVAAACRLFFATYINASCGGAAFSCSGLGTRAVGEEYL